ncbi:MAG: hypothetical protein ACRDH2_10865, partial [Anaerolineales bacterium]
ELENAIKSTATKIAKYVEDAATMQVETKYVEVGADGAAADFGAARPVARTIIKLDGDSETVIPMRKTEAGGLDVDSSLFDTHQRNVGTAIEYRARILDALLETLRSRMG